MAIDSFIMGSSPRDELIRSVVTPIIPQKFKIKNLSGKEAFSEECQCRVPRAEYDSMTIALMELTFRYAAKILIACACDEIDYSPINYSIAEKSIDNMKNNLPQAYCNEIIERYEYAEMKILDFIEHGEDCSENIIQHCWFLSKLDVCYRKDKFPRDASMFFTPADPQIVKELFEMVNLFYTEFLPNVMTKDSKVVFNPNFGYGENLVCETDCDIIIDSSIIDFRTDCEMLFPKTKLLKELTYVMMTEVNKKCGQMHFELDRILFYNARFAETEIFALHEIPEDKYHKTVEKMMIVTEARYKLNNSPFKPGFKLEAGSEEIASLSVKGSDGGNSSANVEVKQTAQQPEKKRHHSLDDTMDIYDDLVSVKNNTEQNKSYSDGYEETIPGRRKLLIRKVTVGIVTAVLVIVAILVLQKVIVDNFGNYDSFTDILTELFGGKE